LNRYLTIVFLVCLALIFFQDLKYRKIHFLLPAAIFILSGLLVRENVQTIVIMVAYNCLFLTLTFGLMFLYVSIKNKSFLNPFKSYFGLGDLLILVGVAPLFLLHQYILFFILSMLFSILLHLGLMRFLKEKTVPLAGYICLLLIMATCSDMTACFPRFTMIHYTI
jgi:hypothetical protein